MAPEVYCTWMLNMFEIRIKESTKYTAKALTADC